MISLEPADQPSRQDKMLAVNVSASRYKLKMS